MNTPRIVFAASLIGAITATTLATFAGLPQPPAAPAPPTAAGTQAAAPDNDPKDRGWPRQFTADGNDVRVYAPQLDAWPNFGRITFRAAISVSPTGSDDRAYGIIKVSADTSIGYEERLVVLTNRKVEDLTFPGVEPAEAERLKAIVASAMPPERPQTVSLDRLVAAMDPAQVNIRKVDVNTAPPTIFSSDKPAVAVIFMGPARFKPVPGSDLQFAINTNWDVFLDPTAARYYLLLDKSWVTTTDLDKGPWTAATSLPGGLSKLPADENWNEVRAAIPGVPAANIPAIFVAHGPTEMIVTNGAPQLEAIPGTGLQFVTNTENDLFYYGADKQYYLLAAGRWFKSAAIAGPWAATSDALPADFKKLPADARFNDVLAAVPGTVAANEAMIMASIPQKATINRNDVKLAVTYEGDPKFQPIPTSTVQYASNTPFSVLLVDGKYYCCNNAVWFEAPAATGPWVVCTAVPAAIYTIPPSCPVYNVTYVQVYESTPTTVVTGYTAGYSGATVAATGVVMFGLGVAVGAALNDDCCWGYHYSPAYYSYGCGAVYHGGSGGYVCGSSYYGPYGGAGHAAAYNPATGVYSRAGYAYGPNGAAGYRTAYNPATGTSAGHAAAVTPYGSYGASAVSNGSQWATASHHTTAAGTTGNIQTSSGAQAATVQGKYGNGTTVAKSSSGDYYASHDGNVYKNTGSGWEQAGGSTQATKTTQATQAPKTTTTTPPPSTTAQAPKSTSTGQVPKSTSDELQQQSQARSRGEQNSARASQYQSGGGSRQAPTRSSGGSRR